MASLRFNLYNRKYIVDAMTSLEWLDVLESIVSVESAFPGYPYQCKSNSTQPQQLDINLP